MPPAGKPFLGLERAGGLVSVTVGDIGRWLGGFGVGCTYEGVCRGAYSGLRLGGFVSRVVRGGCLGLAGATINTMGDVEARFQERLTFLGRTPDGLDYVWQSDTAAYPYRFSSVRAFWGRS